jgi:predicted KAP-like P-loop ATPase
VTGGLNICVLLLNLFGLFWMLETLHRIPSVYLGNGAAMWTDNETTQDFLNFGGIAKTVAEIVRQASSRPVSIGVSGAWGVGKSSMIKLIRQELSTGDTSPNSFIFVEFNAWLYQGYDDARAALIEVVASTLVDEAEKKKRLLTKLRLFLPGSTGFARSNLWRAPSRL